MRRVFMLSIAALLILGLDPALAAKKAEKKDKKEKPAGLTSKQLKKVPNQLQSAVELTGDESPEQMLKAYSEGIAPLVSMLSSNDLPSLQKLEATVHRASRPGAEKERAACCQAIAAAAQQDLPLESRVWLLKQLTDTGKAEVIPALVKLLDDKEERVREAARCALQNNPAPGAVEALRAALDRADAPARKAAFALSLGARKDTASVPAIAKVAGGGDKQAAAVALDALAMIGDADAAKAIRGVLDKQQGELRDAAANALIKCGKAEDLAFLNDAKYPAHIRCGALNRILESKGDDAAPQIIDLLKGTDADARQIALSQLRNLGPRSRKELLAGIDALPNNVQAVLLQSLANLGDKKVLPKALEFARSSDSEMHVAGIAALGRLGDESVVTPLCQSLATSTNATEYQQIEQVLISLSGGKDTDKALIEAMKKNSGQVKNSLMSVLSKRNCHDAFEALLAETDNQDTAAARSAFQALANVSAVDDAPAIVQRLADIKKGELRSEAENTAARTLAKIDKPSDRTAVVLPVFEKTTDIDARAAVLRLFRVSGDAKALDTVKAALQNKEQRIRDSAMRTLGEWPDDSAWAPLYEIYSKPEKESHRVLALRGLVRLATGQPDSPNPRLFDRCTQLMQSTDKVDDRKLILGGLGNAKVPAAIKVVEPLLSDPSVKAEARMAIKRIAESIKRTHPKESNAALEQLKKAK